MFVPRALRLKGVKESQKPEGRTTLLPSLSKNQNNNDKNSPVHAIEETSTTPPAEQAQNDPEETTRGPRFTTASFTPEFVAQVAAGVELIFTDYAHQEFASAKWLQDRYRTADGEENFIHLTAILEHPNISSLKPQATQVLLRQAVKQHGKATLELSTSGFHVRRRPSTYPLPFIPPNSFEVVNDEGLGYWDQRTIYVEPHIRHLCKTPAKVAHWLKEHGQIKAKWLPIQAVHTLYNSCAFVVLSGNVMHEDVWQKWRAMEKPVDWKIMTKVEHLKRTEEYVELLKQERSNLKKQRKSPTSPQDTHAQSASTIPNTEPIEENQRKKKTKKRKRNRGSTGIRPISEDTNMTEDTGAKQNQNLPGERTA